MLITARYTEVLDNLLRNEQTAPLIATAMSKYPLYATDPNKTRKYGTAYAVPTRAELNNKILSYYRFREIGFETVGRFLFELETALNEIMPKYNQLFYSADQDFNPIYNVDYNKTLARNKTNADSGTTTSSTSSSDNLRVSALRLHRTSLISAQLTLTLLTMQMKPLGVQATRQVVLLDLVPAQAKRMRPLLRRLKVTLVLYLLKTLSSSIVKLSSILNSLSSMTLVSLNSLC